MEPKIYGKDWQTLSQELTREGFEVKDMESIEEINEKYKGEWVLLGNCTVEVTAGEVLFHSKDKKEFDEAFQQLGQPNEAHSYFVVLCLGAEEE